MKTLTWFAITLAAAVTAGGLTSLNAYAADAPAQRPLRGRLLERAKEKLGLTDDQIAQIKAELAPEKQNLQNLLTRLHEVRVGLRNAIQAPDATEASVRVAAAKVASVEADFAVERLKLHGKISPILTAGQRQKLGQFQARVDEFVDGAINRIGERSGQ